MGCRQRVHSFGPVLAVVGLQMLCQLGIATVLPEQRLQTLLSSMAFDSFYMSAADMGVQHYNWTFSMDNPTYPHSPPQLSVRLHLFIKYLHWEGQGRVKGFVMAETRDASKIANGIPLEPVFILRSIGQIPRQQHAFIVKCQVHSYWDPPHQAAMVYGFEHNFTISSACKHEYDVLLDLEPTVYQLKPLKDLNQIDGRGIEVPPVAPGAPGKRETVVVLKPLYNFTPAVFGPLIDRHVDYYAQLGVTKHIIYLRREHIPQMLMGNPKVARYVQVGRIMLILWDQLAEHEVWHRKYDQRVIYSHALLALSSMDMYIINIDLDEYLVTTKPSLQNSKIQDVIEGCAGQGAEIRVQRFHTVCKACEHDKPEALIWTNYLDTNHPLSWYHLTNYAQVPAGRAIVNPNFLRAFYIHYGALSPGFNVTLSEDKCMFFLHIANMVRVTEGPEVVDAHYTEDHSWMGILKRFKSIAPINIPSPSPPPAAAGRRHLMLDMLSGLEESPFMTTM